VDLPSFEASPEIRHFGRDNRRLDRYCFHQCFSHHCGQSKKKFDYRSNFSTTKNWWKLYFPGCNTPNYELYRSIDSWNIDGWKVFHCSYRTPGCCKRHIDYHNAIRGIGDCSAVDNMGLFNFVVNSHEKLANGFFMNTCSNFKLSIFLDGSKS